jgi:hypothetical protein
VHLLLAMCFLHDQEREYFARVSAKTTTPSTGAGETCIAERCIAATISRRFALYFGHP